MADKKKCACKGCACKGKPVKKVPAKKPEPKKPEAKKPAPPNKKAVKSLASKFRKAHIEAVGAYKLLVEALIARGEATVKKGRMNIDDFLASLKEKGY